MYVYIIYVFISIKYEIHFVLCCIVLLEHNIFFQSLTAPSQLSPLECNNRTKPLPVMSKTIRRLFHAEHFNAIIILRFFACGLCLELHVNQSAGFSVGINFTHASTSSISIHFCLIVFEQFLIHYLTRAWNRFHIYILKTQVS